MVVELALVHRASLSRVQLSFGAERWIQSPALYQPGHERQDKAAPHKHSSLRFVPPALDCATDVDAIGASFLRTIASHTGRSEEARHRARDEEHENNRGPRAESRRIRPSALAILGGRNRGGYPVTLDSLS